MNNRLKTLMIAGRVKRFHTIECIREQTIGDHSWRVAQIVMHVEPDASGELIRAALHHDIPEYYTGDIPAPIKREKPGLDEIIDAAEYMVHMNLRTGTLLNDQEKEILKFSDNVDLLIWCEEEMDMGNTRVADMHKKVCTYIEKSVIPNDACRELLQSTLYSQWVLAV